MDRDASKILIGYFLIILSISLILALICDYAVDYAAIYITRAFLVRP